MLKIPGRLLLAALAELAALGLEVGPEFRPGRVPQQQSSPAQPSPAEACFLRSEKKKKNLRNIHQRHSSE